MKLNKIAAVLMLAGTALAGCGQSDQSSQNPQYKIVPEYENRLNIYEPVTLSADLSQLSENQKTLVGLLI